MTYARRASLADDFIHLESHERALNKLARTFVAQVEALTRYRSKGKRRVIVLRVTVEANGDELVYQTEDGSGGRSSASRRMGAHRSYIFQAIRENGNKTGADTEPVMEPAASRWRACHFGDGIKFHGGDRASASKRAWRLQFG
jgi:hypothetical protein